MNDDYNCDDDDDEVDDDSDDDKDANNYDSKDKTTHATGLHGWGGCKGAREGIAIRGESFGVLWVSG